MFKLMPPTMGGIRQGDKHGSGVFGAPRGSLLHKGVDYLVRPGDAVVAPCRGVVTRLGRCYADTDEYKLVEINTGVTVVRVLYVQPIVGGGDYVTAGEPIGFAADLTKRYPGISNHVHLEVRLIQGTVLMGRGERSGGDDRTPSHIWVDPGLFME